MKVRQLIGTVFGRPILGLEAARQGDCGCVLHGCPVPVVLSRTIDRYVLVGERYADDMTGSNVQMSLTEFQADEVAFNIK